MIYKNRAEEVTHKSKVDLTNLKMDMLKQRGDLERERDKLSNLVEGNYPVIVLLKVTVLKKNIMPLFFFNLSYILE